MPGPAGAAYLIVLGGGIPGAMLRLGPGGNDLGRSADNTFQLDDMRSRGTTRPSATDAPAGPLTDLGSTNGTFLNGRRLPDNAPVRVQDGDRVQLGVESSSSSSASTRARSNSSARCSSGPSATR